MVEEVLVARLEAYFQDKSSFREIKMETKMDALGSRVWNYPS